MRFPRRLTSPLASSPRRLPRFGAAVVATALLAAACGGNSTTVTDESLEAAGLEPTESAVDPTPSDVEVEPTAEPEPEPTAEPTTPAPTAGPAPTATPEPVEVTSWTDVYTVGDCYDDLDDGDGFQASDPLGCDTEHQFEIYLIGESDLGPDEPYPTGAVADAFYDDLLERVCDPATIEFAGRPWEDLPLVTSVWTPSEADWTAGDRGFLCTAEAGLPDENPYKVGTAAGGTLTSEEGIVGRATVAGQRDFYFSFQSSTLYPLTSGEYDLPALTPQVVSSGFLFAAPPQDEGDANASAYTFDFESLDVFGLDTGLADYDLATPLFILDPPTFVFAARETTGDDWDLYSSRTGEEPVALTDSPDDDRWATLTPDSTRIVYNSGGSIWSMNIDGTDKQQLTDDEGDDYESAVSPDGQRIVFASDRSGNDDIWSMNLDGTDLQNLTQHPANDAWPFFSADGSIIYFQTDRLGANSNIMMMELDGSNQSYFSFEFQTNAALLPQQVTERFQAELQPVGEATDDADLQEFEVVPGAEGERTAIEHSSSRMVIQLPGGWEYDEFPTDEVAAFVAAPSIAEYDSSWAADGVFVTLIEGERDAVEAYGASAIAANDSSCTEETSSTDIDGSRTTTVDRYSCGTGGTALVVVIYESERQLGVVFEGQWDGDPDDESDEALITAIGQTLQWR